MQALLVGNNPNRKKYFCLRGGGVIYYISMTNQPTATPAQPQRDFNPWLVYAICLGISCLFMFFFGLNSPIHTFNSHCDYQWFMTMGRGIVAGKVPYRDLFEHKGPLVYAVFAVASLFPNAQVAIWCFEVFCINLFLFFCYRIARKFLSPWLSLMILPLMMLVLSTNYCRGIDGSCVEEYCLPIFAYGLLCFLDFLMDQRSATWRRSLAIGICLGILLWVKFTMWEFFLVPMLIWLITNLVRRKFAEIFRAGLIMLGGCALITIPVLIGYAAVGALDDLFMVYFQINITRYSGSDVEFTAAEAAVRPWKNLLKVLVIGSWFSVMLIWGVICFTVQYWRKKGGYLMLISVIVTWLMMGFFGEIAYYYLPMFTYAVLGVVYSVKVVVHALQSVEITIRRRWASTLAILIVTVVSFLAALPLVTSCAEINRPREAYAPLMVADIIAEYNRTVAQPATLFCYRMADCGFYNAAGLIPNVYYYGQNTFTENVFPEMFAAFDQTISDQLCDFVVTYKDVYLEKEDFLSVYYHPYADNDLAASTLPFNFFEPGGYGHNEIVILFRNA